MANHQPLPPSSAHTRFKNLKNCWPFQCSLSTCLVCVSNLVAIGQNLEEEIIFVGLLEKVKKVPKSHHLFIRGFLKHFCGSIHVEHAYHILF